MLTLTLALSVPWMAPGPAVSAPSVFQVETSAPAVCDVRVHEGELTVDVRNTPLAQVLETIGEKAAVDVTLRGDLSGPITLSFAGRPLEEGIRRLTRGHSLAVAYAVPADQARPKVLAAIWVVSGASTGEPRADTERARPVPSRQAEPTGSEATGPSPIADWIDGIQALTGEADLGSRAAVARLAEISALEPAALVREQAVAALGRLSGADVEPALVAALADDDASVRVRAVRGLRATGTDTAMQSLVGVVTGDADPQVRLAALRALASFPGRPPLQELAKATADPNDLIRETAIQALSWWNTRPSGASQ